MIADLESKRRGNVGQSVRAAESAVETQPSNIIEYGTRPRRPRWIIPLIFACLLLAAGGVYRQRTALSRWCNFDIKC